jgi:beta-glucosidase-like glycosyl hydrolase
MSLAKSVGQLIIARFAGTVPTSSILAAIRAGHVGGIILYGDNTAGGVEATQALVSQLQSAAHAGSNPGS